MVDVVGLDAMEAFIKTKLRESGEAKFIDHVSLQALRVSSEPNEKWKVDESTLERLTRIFAHHIREAVISTGEPCSLSALYTFIAVLPKPQGLTQSESGQIDRNIKEALKVAWEKEEAAIKGKAASGISHSARAQR